METIDILQLIYDRSAIDEKMNLRQAFPEMRFVPGKLTLPDIVVKWNKYIDIQYVDKLFPDEHGRLHLYAENDIVQRPHNSIEFSTVYIRSPTQFALHTGPYRIVKYVCDDKTITKVMTCNEDESQLPDLYMRQPFLYYKYELTWRCPPWQTHQEYLEDLDRIMAEAQCITLKAQCITLKAQCITLKPNISR